MNYFKNLIGKRIYLSPMREEDAEQYTAWLNDLRVTATLGRAGLGNLQVESERKWIKEKGDAHQYAIVRESDNALLGNCGYNSVDARNQSAEVGLFIGDPAEWGKGYGTEALSLLLEYGFHQLNLHSIYLIAFAFNERGLACYKKLGFTECGRRHECQYVNGAWQDEVMMEYLRESWEKRNA